jgi:hypothetical protein
MTIQLVDATWPELALLVLAILGVLAAVYYAGYSAAQSKYTLRQARKEVREAFRTGKEHKINAGDILATYMHTQDDAGRYWLIGSDSDKPLDPQCVADIANQIAAEERRQWGTNDYGIVVMGGPGGYEMFDMRGRRSSVPDDLAERWQHGRYRYLREKQEYAQRHFCDHLKET